MEQSTLIQFEYEGVCQDLRIETKRWKAYLAITKARRERQIIILNEQAHLFQLIETRRSNENVNS